MRVMITGGNGFVGREIVRSLLGRENVCVVDSVRYGSVRFGDEELARFRFETIDLRDAAAVRDVVANFDPHVVLHLAAIHFIPECEDDPASAVGCNVSGTVNLLSACRPGTRFVFASSGAVYSPSDEPHNETRSDIAPSDIYGLTKLHGEQYVRYLVEKRGLHGVVVRLFNVAGPGETNPHVLPEIVAQLKSGRRMIRLGNTWPRRDYIHVKDAANGFLAVALGARIEAGETVTVNLGSSRPYSVADVLAKLQVITGLNIEVQEDKDRVRAVDRPVLAADISAISAVFQWSPAYTLDDALTDLWRNPDFGSDLAAKYR